MRKAYFSISYASRKNLQAEVTAIREALKEYGIELFVFVDIYQFGPDQSRQMMQQAFADIDDSDLLIAEVSEKAIGVGIEIGYAAARAKPVIYLRNSRAEHSTTAAGCTDHIVIYNDGSDLTARLSETIRLIPLGLAH